MAAPLVPGCTVAGQATGADAARRMAAPLAPGAAGIQSSPALRAAPSMLL
jgi:hypothetical protein